MDGLNRYSYVYDSPETYVDPSGNDGKLRDIVRAALLETALAAGMLTGNQSPQEAAQQMYNGVPVAPQAEPVNPSNAPSIEAVESEVLTISEQLTQDIGNAIGVEPPIYPGDGNYGGGAGSDPPIGISSIPGLSGNDAEGTGTKGGSNTNPYLGPSGPLAGTTKANIHPQASSQPTPVRTQPHYSPSPPPFHVTVPPPNVWLWAAIASAIWYALSSGSGGNSPSEVAPQPAASGGGGYSGGQSQGGGGAVGDPDEGGCSFSPDTLVATPTGERMIGSLHIGDAVLAYNPVTGKAERQTIVKVWVDYDQDLVNVQLVAGQSLTSTSHDHGITPETIHTTANHPWLTIDRGWVAAGDLRAGELVAREGGTTAVVTQVQVVAGAATRYNLEVTNDHTFAVGLGQYVVHNDCL